MIVLSSGPVSLSWEKPRNDTVLQVIRTKPFYPQQSMEFKTQRVLFYELPMQFYLFWYQCGDLKASEMILFFRYICTPPTFIQVSLELLLGALGLFLISEKLHLNVWENVAWIVSWVTRKVRWAPGASLPDPTLTWPRWLGVPLWLATSVLTQHSAWNNCRERTKPCFLLGPRLLTWKGGVCQVHLDRAPAFGAGSGVRVHGCSWIPHILKE